MVKIKTRTVDKNKYKNYLIKTNQFLSSMRNALAENNWNAVGLNAVHAVISANDALCVYYHGVRCVSEKHADAGKILVSLFNTKEAKEKSIHLIWLINHKNLVEYDDRLFQEKEAKQAAKHTERFIDWVRNKIPR